MKSASRLYGASTVQMELTEQSESVTREFEDHRFGAVYE
jgi:N utilization substance protein B